MNENIDVAKILDGCPKGTILYSPIFGNVEFEAITKDKGVPCLIVVIATDFKGNESYETFLPNGKPDDIFNNTECLLFPSKEQRDWSKFERFWDKPKVEKFDPNTFQPFDRVIVRDDVSETWNADLFSYYDDKDYDECYFHTIGGFYRCGIPYNEDTKHLVGTTDDCPDYYKWWEE